MSGSLWGRGAALRVCSSDEHPLLKMMQVPMEVTSWSDLEHRQVRSEAVQPIVVAEELRQVRAHWGSWLTTLLRSPLPVEVGAEPVVTGVAAD